MAPKVTRKSLAIIATISIIFNIFLTYKLFHAIMVLNLTELRLREFAFTTSTLISRHTKIPISSINTERLGLFDHSIKNENYIIQLMDYSDFGVKFIYDNDGYLTELQEYPRVPKHNFLLFKNFKP